LSILNFHTFAGEIKRHPEAMERWMIRFAEMASFSGVQQAFSVRKAITSGRFSC